MTTTQELQVCRNAAPHLRGIPASQNAYSIDCLETALALEEITARFGADEIARCNSMETSAFA